jgi:predicted amidohydrolase YtcJ
MPVPRALLRFLLLTPLLWACTQDQGDRPRQTADLLLVNGKIFTKDAQRSWAQVMAIRDGRIVYVGPDSGAVVLGDSDGHTLWVNTAALALAGVDAATPDPEGGEIGRASNDEPSGSLLDGPAMKMLVSRLPAYTLEQREADLVVLRENLFEIPAEAISDARVLATMLEGSVVFGEL